ncbi:MAG: LbtU family siderophore porin [Legionellales bacterium]|nr:LbtU family siderophore porin [Legionellales bacterium]
MSTGKLRPIVRALYLISLSIAYNNAFAAASSSADSTVMVQKMAAEEHQLQQQMEVLQTEMTQLHKEQAELIAQTRGSAPKPVKSSKNTTKSTTTTSAKPKNPVAKTATSTATVSQPTPTSTQSIQKISQPSQANSQSANKLQLTTQNPNGTTTKVPYGGTMLGNIGGFAVITSPYLHPQSAFNGADLIVNFSSVNKDASMLQQRQEFMNAMSSLGFGLPSSGSLLELSGEVEADTIARTTFNNGNQTDLYVGDAELDMEALMNRWITAFADFAYNNTPNDVGDRVGGTIYLDNGFFTVGNLNVTPWRLTVGQLYVPFGQFNSYLISDPINKTLFRTKGQPLLIGYGVPGENGFSGALYTFKGISTQYGTTDLPNPYINQYGADANYQFNLGKVKTNLGVSYIANVADSFGFQFPGFDDLEFGNQITGEGFSTSTETEHLQHQVPGVDFRASFGAGPVTLIGEFDTVTRSFSPQDLSFNGDGAAPMAYHLEGVYSFTINNWASTFSIGHDQSYEALGLAVPEMRTSAALNISFWRNTVASLELRHDNQYSEDDTAGGNGAVIFNPEGDDTSNAITAQFQVYF